MNKKTKIIAILTLALLSLSILCAVALSPLLLNSTGTVISTPSDLTANPASIIWGNINRGHSTEQQVTLTNTGETTTAPLHMSYTVTRNSLPITGITLTWNQEGVTVSSGANLLASFTLTIAPEVTNGEFAVAISITY